MKIITSAQIQGPEATGEARIVEVAPGQFQLDLINFWVAPGAPDVRIVLSKNPEGQIEREGMQFLAKLPPGNFEQSFPINPVEDMEAMKTAIVYCEQFFVHFGHGTLQKP